MPFPNHGAQLLADGVTHEGVSFYSVEKALGCSLGYLGRLTRGQVKPGRELAIKLRDRFGIAVDAWDEPAKPKSGPGTSDPESPDTEVA